MKCYGWTLSEIKKACIIASERLGHGTILEPINFNIITLNCRRGGHTTQFILRFGSKTSRLLKRDRICKEAEYPPGVLVRDGYTVYFNRTVIDPIPWVELTSLTSSRKRIIRLESKPFRRSCASPCWHAFGHFFRVMFTLNNRGKIITGKVVYDGADGFEENYLYSDGNIGSLFRPIVYSEACDCRYYGVERFF